MYLKQKLKLALFSDFKTLAEVADFIANEFEKVSNDKAFTGEVVYDEFNSVMMGTNFKNKILSHSVVFNEVRQNKIGLSQAKTNIKNILKGNLKDLQRAKKLKFIAQGDLDALSFASKQSRLNYDNLSEFVSERNVYFF